MNKSLALIFSTALLVVSSCSKVETGLESRKEISFEVANFVHTRASGVKYDTDVNFGTYSWFNATDPFMVNEEVGYNAGVWKTVNHTFYWPKTGSLDFISYSPFSGENASPGTVPSVTKGNSGYSIDYSGYTVGTDDIMYADLATCAANVDEVTDDEDGTADSGFTGVPTLFHHALAKVIFSIRANFLEYGTGTDKTKWEVTVTNAKLSGIYTKGDCSLSWDSANKSWSVPADSVWTPSGSATISTVGLGDNGMKLTTTAQPLADLGFVIPQALEDQALELTVAIKTTLPNGKVINETWESGPIALADVASLDSWKMNHIISYTINIKPTASSETDPTPDNPNDVVITFDPAVADWVSESAGITIQL